jgi:ribonucleoside-diphosphate reductase alpha chain
MTRFAAPIAEQIWDMKYRFKEADGTPLDGTVEDTWRRIARALAVVEKDADHWENEFYGALEDFKFLPAGRITAGAGTARKVTLFNCFVMGTIPDSMGGIFDMLTEAALTMQQGGGIGYDFSTIRPKGALVTGVAADASGPLSFMDVWDSMCRTIMSAGSRRGAMMATMRCDHPDIEDFITAKSDAARLRMFNVSCWSQIRLCKRSRPTDPGIWCLMVRCIKRLRRGICGTKSCGPPMIMRNPV